MHYDVQLILLIRCEFCYERTRGGILSRVITERLLMVDAYQKENNSETVCLLVQTNFSWKEASGHL